MAAAFDPNTIDWNLLRAFVTVIEHGSLTRAAQRLGASQPTLSRQIAALEAQIGAPLFERAARRLKPTPQALALAEPAARMLAAAQAMAHGAASASHQLAGTVRLTASEVVSAHVLPPILARLASQHPEIQIELVASNRLDNLLEREADIAVRMLRPAQGTLITRHLADWPLGFFAHRRLLARRTKPTRDNLLQQRWIGFDQQMQLIEGFRAAGFEVDRSLFGFRCDNQIVDYEALRAGLGIGIAMLPLAAREPQLVRVLPEIELPVLPVWLTAHRELRASRRLRLVFDALAEGLLAWGQGAPG
ncbi:MAG: LysR family transcriptional regulator [Burkholderiales bacterium]|nr:LysR family transcriptional regulator [Burkholderiales bacterium]